jgi:hypothetical protein
MTSTTTLTTDELETILGSLWLVRGKGASPIRADIHVSRQIAYEARTELFRMTAL